MKLREPDERFDDSCHRDFGDRARATRLGTTCPRSGQAGRDGAKLKRGPT